MFLYRSVLAGGDVPFSRWTSREVVTGDPTKSNESA